MPLLLRWLAPLMKGRVLTKGIPPGFKLPDNMQALRPAAVVETADGLRALRSLLSRIRSGDRMSQPSPLLGRMSHEDWVELHLRHCELHLSFVHFPDDADG